MKQLLTLAFFIISILTQAQTDTLYFTKTWKFCIKDSAVYYRLYPKKIKTKQALGYKIKATDSLYVINDYYLNNNQLQFNGYAFDKDAEILAGKAIWYDTINKPIDIRYYNYKRKSKIVSGLNSVLYWKPIFYIDYFYVDRHQLKGGLEFCLNEESRDKLFVGLGYGLVNYNRKIYALPDYHISYNFERNPLFLKLGGSHKHLYSMIGISLLNLIDLGIGYSFPFNKYETPNIQGFTAGITLRLTHNDKAYPRLKIGF